MRIGLDTSVVVRLLTGEPADLAGLAFERVERALDRGDTLVVSDLVASETYFALQRHFGLSKARALEALGTFFSDGAVSASGAAADVLLVPKLATSDPGFVDRMIHAGYQSTVDRMLTFERSGTKLARTEVLAGEGASRNAAPTGSTKRSRPS